MIKICEICTNKFDMNSATRIYCYNCSGDSTRTNVNTRKNQKTILRRNMKQPSSKNIVILDINKSSLEIG